MKIFIFRHGETDWNKKGLVQGRSDIPLNATGCLQAVQISQILRGMKFDALITSPLQRAVNTGKIITQYSCVNTVKTDERLIEKDFGICDGMPIQKRKELYPNWHAPQEESYKIVKQRMHSAISDYAKEFKNDIVIVSHGTAIAALLKTLESQYCDLFIRPSNLSMTIVNSEDLSVEKFDMKLEDSKKWMENYRLHVQKKY